METFYKFFILIYFIIYFGVAFVAKTVIVARRTGQNPLVLPKDDSAYGLIGNYFKYTLTGLFIYVIINAFLGSWRMYIPAFSFMDYETVKITGTLLCLTSLLWTVIAQYHMRDSWRIGIDNENKTELVTNGLFRYSRNPIFLGMIISLIGLFLITPDGFTLLFLVLGYVLIQVQIRLEEDFLARTHGKVYLEYKNEVRRLI